MKFKYFFSRCFRKIVHMRTIMLKCRAICSKITDLGLDSLDKEKAASQNISERE